MREGKNSERTWSRVSTLLRWLDRQEVERLLIELVRLRGRLTRWHEASCRVLGQRLGLASEEELHRLETRVRRLERELARGADQPEKP